MSERSGCRETLAAISAYLDGDLDTPSCSAIEEHCARCPRCAGLVSGLREITGICRQTAAMPLPDAVRERARTSVRRLLEAEEETKEDEPAGPAGAPDRGAQS